MKKEIVIQNFPYIKCFYLKVAKLEFLTLSAQIVKII